MDDTLTKFQQRTRRQGRGDADGHGQRHPAVHECRGRRHVRRTSSSSSTASTTWRTSGSATSTRSTASFRRPCSSRPAATKLSIYKGKQYRVGFYAVGFGIAVQQEPLPQGRARPEQRRRRRGTQFLDRVREAEGEGLHPDRRRRQGRLPRRVVPRQRADAEPRHRRPTRSTCSSASSTGTTRSTTSTGRSSRS